MINLRIPLTTFYRAWLTLRLFMGSVLLFTVWYICRLQVFFPCQYDPQSKVYSYDINLPHCKIAYMDPRDKSIWAYINGTNERLVCDSRAALTTLRRGVLSLDPYVLSKYYPGTVLGKCVYRVILRDYQSSNPDSHVRYSRDNVSFLERTLVTEEFIGVECMDNLSHTFYKNIHANGYLSPDYVKRKILGADRQYSWINYSITREYTSREPLGKDKSLNPHHGEEIKVGSKSLKDLKVLMFGIDSVSRLNFIRSLPLSHSYLMSKRPDSFMFKGYIKVADNTFPNLIPLTTGKFVGELPDRFGVDHYFDSYANVTYIWDSYKRAGFVTAYLEDTADIGTFNYAKKGFHRPPTHFFSRPFSLEVLKFNVRTNCVGDKHEARSLLEYTRGLLETLKDRPYFCFAYSSGLSHGYVNKVKYMDGMILDHFKHLFEERLLDDTLVILYGDHGMRFGEFRKTFIGMMEERMPLLYILPPKWLLTAYPEIGKSFATNIRRIVTPFDVHATLLHLLELIVHSNLTGVQADTGGRVGPPSAKSSEYSRLNRTSRSYSLLEQVPPDRTCEMAEIPQHYCPCNVVGTISDIEGIEWIQGAANAMIDKVNSLLSPQRELCQELGLHSIKSVRIFRSDLKAGDDADILRNDLLNSLMGSNRSHNSTNPRESIPLHTIQLSGLKILITIKVKPSSALFEASVVYNEESKRYDVICGDISRVNKYNKQSACIQDPVLRKYCYCK